MGVCVVHPGEKQTRSCAYPLLSPTRFFLKWFFFPWPSPEPTGKQQLRWVIINDFFLVSRAEKPKELSQFVEEKLRSGQAAKQA